MIQISFQEPNGNFAQWTIHEGLPFGVALESPYLVSAGQHMDLTMIARVVPPRPVGGHLWDGRGLHATHDRGLPLVDVPPTWDYSAIPTTRTLAEIMGEAVQHGLDNPRHGTDCACMDNLIREARNQISKTVPPDTRPYDQMISQGEIHDRIFAKQRISVILRRLTGSI